MKKYGFLLSGKWVGLFVLTVVASLVCLYLASWQMSRKEALDFSNERISQNYDAAPLDFADDSSLFASAHSELRWQPVLMGGVLLLAGGIVLVNLLSLSDWYLRAANLVALAVLWIITAYVFTVLAALDVQGLRAQLVSALMLGIGSLHWTILGTTAVVIGYGLMLRFAVPLLALFGVGLPAAVFAAICSRILRDLEPSSAEEPRTTPRPLAHSAARTVARSRRPSSVSDPVRPLTKGTPA